MERRSATTNRELIHKFIVSYKKQGGSVLGSPQHVPVLTDMKAWLLATRHSVTTGSATAKSIDHALKRWPALEQYVSAGHLPVDNNPVENAIRPIAIGKKNWLFTGSERAGCRAAAIQSLFPTAKLNSLDPARWLAETLDKLPTCPQQQNRFPVAISELYNEINVSGD